MPDRRGPQRAMRFFPGIHIHMIKAYHWTAKILRAIALKAFAKGWTKDDFGLLIGQIVKEENETSVAGNGIIKAQAVEQWMASNLPSINAFWRRVVVALAFWAARYAGIIKAIALLLLAGLSMGSVSCAASRHGVRLGTDTGLRVTTDAGGTASVDGAGTLSVSGPAEIIVAENNSTSLKTVADTGRGIAYAAQIGKTLRSLASGLKDYGLAKEGTKVTGIRTGAEVEKAQIDAGVETARIEAEAAAAAAQAE